MSYLDNDYIGKNKDVGLKVELTEDIDRRIMEHRNRFRRLIFNRYVEFYPYLSIIQIKIQLALISYNLRLL